MSRGIGVRVPRGNMGESVKDQTKRGGLSLTRIKKKSFRRKKTKKKSDLSIQRRLFLIPLSPSHPHLLCIFVPSSIISFLALLVLVFSIMFNVFFLIFFMFQFFFWSSNLPQMHLWKSFFSWFDS